MRVNDYIDLFDSIREYDLYLSGMERDRKLEKDSFVLSDLKDAVTLISGVIYELTPEEDSALLSLLSPEGSVEAFALERSLQEWLNRTREDIDVLSKCFLTIDYDFERMMLTVERCSEQALFKRLLLVLASFAIQAPSEFEMFSKACSEFEHLWGGFDPGANKYDHFVNGIRAVKGHVDDIRWLYNTVEDYRSRKVLYGIIRFWLELDFKYKNAIIENNYNDYFDLDVLRDTINFDEVFVDCGCYIGDTAQSFFDNFSCCKRMYLYDMVPDNLQKARAALEGHDEIVFRNAGVGSPDQAGNRIIVNSMESASFSLGERGEIYNPRGIEADTFGAEVVMVTIDEDIKEPITFLKMDIEGAEMNALVGAKEHIIKDHPKLAICTYHHYEHLWEIPRFIKSLNPDYRLFFRYNGPMNGITASEHVVIAV